MDDPGPFVADEFHDLGESQLVIEAVTEDRGVKAGVFDHLDALMPADVILASNTSSIPIAELASHTENPGRVLGLHFFAPVPVMKLVEVVVALETSAEAVAGRRHLDPQLAPAADA